jgi:hypothetical protein
MVIGLAAGVAQFESREPECAFNSQDRQAAQVRDTIQLLFGEIEKVLNIKNLMRPKRLDDPLVRVRWIDF